MFQSFRPSLIIALMIAAFALTGCDKAKEAADTAAESAKETVANTADKAVDAAKDAASATVDKAKEVAAETVDKATEAASGAADAAKDKVAEITDSMTTTDTATDAPSATEEAAAVAAAPAADSGKGKEVYDSVCFACHAQGIAGSPKLGDKETWAPRIAKGMDTLYGNSINGFTGESGSMMPAKGGRVDVADDDIKAAVDYMVAESQ